MSAPKVQIKHHKRLTTNSISVEKSRYTCANISYTVSIIVFTNIAHTTSSAKRYELIWKPIQYMFYLWQYKHPF